MPYVVTGGVGGSEASLVTFGLLDDDIVSVLPPNLVAAIIWRAEEELDAFESGVPGKFHVGTGDRDTQVPYVALFPMYGERHRNAGRHYWVAETVRASIFANDFHEAWTLGRELGEMFDEDEPLYIEGQSPVRITTGEFIYVGEDNYQGRALHHGYVEMTAISTRERA
jgi:hypothetical protein